MTDAQPLVPLELPSKLYEPFMLLAPWQCDKLLELAQQKELQTGRAGGTVKSQIRNNRVSWVDLHHDYWRWFKLFEQFDDPDTLWLQEPFQVSAYNPGEFYDWHCDDDVRNGNSRRHFTMTCTLASAPGAVFETQDTVYDLDPGWAVVIPSSCEHRATAPAEGTRWSFTIWCMKRLNNVS